jgi:uncharacterized protein (DUF1810 family)
MSDPFDLERFVHAQDAVMSDVRHELRAGRKRTHWMWFVFPQLRALGRSATAQRYGIPSLAEARAYLAHPVLGPRLAECADMILAVEGRSAHDILGSPDDAKLRSSMTLFAAAAPDPAVFEAVLQKYYAGVPDSRTIELLPNG